MINPSASSVSLDLAFARSQFPALAGEWVFMDNAGGSQILGSVVDRIRDYLLTSNVQLGATYDVSVQAVSKHLKVLGDAGLVSRTKEAQRRPVHLEAEVFDLMTHWIERYRRQAEERYRRLDDVLRSLPDDIEPVPPTNPQKNRGSQ